MTATFMSAFNEPFALVLKKPGVLPHPPLVESNGIVQPASVPMRERSWLGRDPIMYPPAKVFQGVVDWRWVGIMPYPLTGQASQEIRHDQLATVLCHIAGMLALSCRKIKLFPTV